ncbi:MAG TPA: GNAT family N-acetyltransferase [Actinomycetota bacterium]|nr:GNAT family N-acetyltransferase [Actinomycetota bacterium]
MLRFALEEDLPFLKWMLYEACYPEKGPRPPFEKGISDPKVWVYLDGWMRKGDAGLIVTSPAGGPQGAAWYRLFTPDAAGYGFYDAETPELAVALVYEARGKGIGTQLTQALMTLARKQGHRRISLGVDRFNPDAERLYRRLGFKEFDRDADGVKMVADLTEPPAGSSPAPSPPASGTS